MAYIKKMTKSLAEKMRTLTIKDQALRERINKLYRCAKEVSEVVRPHDYDRIIDSINQVAKKGSSNLLWRVDVNSSDLRDPTANKIVARHMGCSELELNSLERESLFHLINTFLLLRWSKMLIDEEFLVHIDQDDNMIVTWN